jgi:hypothetical protein
MPLANGVDGPLTTFLRSERTIDYVAVRGRWAIDYVAVRDRSLHGTAGKAHRARNRAVRTDRRHRPARDTPETAD